MNDIRRTILWVIFGFSLVLLWDQWQVYNGRNPTFLPSTKPHATATAPAAAPAGAASGAASSAVPPATSTTPSSASGAGAVPDGKTAAPAASEKVVVTTDVLKLTFDTEGGSLVQSEFIQHDDLTEKDKPFVLLDQSAEPLLRGPDRPDRRHLPHPQDADDLHRRAHAEGGCQRTGAALRIAPTWAASSWSRPGRSSAAPTTCRCATRSSTPARRRSRRSSICRSCATATSRRASRPSTRPSPARRSTPTPRSTRRSSSRTSRSNKADFVKEATNGYVAMVQHYFASAWLLKDGVPRDLFARKVDNNLYAVGMITPAGAVAPGASKAIDAELFVGPQAEKTARSRRARPRTGQGLRHLHDHLQAALLAARQAAQACSATGAGRSSRWWCC